MKKIDLCGKWEVYGKDERHHIGHVPGCIHTDLFQKEELFYETNSKKGRFVEEENWKYKKSFWVEELLQKPILVFEGLDTYCDIWLNGHKIGIADNMFVPHRFSVDGILQEGENLLEVQFYSPTTMVQHKPELMGAFSRERLHTRRMQCTYGWDWIDRFVTCGIYRPVYIEFETGMMLDNVYVYTSNIDEYSAQIKVVEQFKNFEEGTQVKTTILNPQGKQVSCQESYCEEKEHSLYFDIEEPHLWFPKPYGEQPLYELVVSIDGEVYRQKFGIRTVKILQLMDRDEISIHKCRALQATESGREYDANTEYSGFVLIINGVKIFCTGANWVPCEPFPSAETDEKITTLLEKAQQAGINMIRVWGGGLFEKEHFYNECDRLGILVTQDFLMACGEYPEEDEAFQAHLQREAEYAAIYLRNHPSLVWWTGDNENAILGYDKKESYPGRIISRKVIAQVLEKLDYNRRFLLSSPYGGEKYASKTAGTTHNTQFMGSIFRYLSGDDISDYREYWEEYTGRFIAEEPIMGAVSKKTLHEFISEENEESYDMWLYHTKTNPILGRELMDIMIDFAEKLFGTFSDWEERCFKLRYLQYEWVRFTLGIARSNLWFNSGILYWMLNDCWPAAIGWSLCDYYTREKAGYYALKTYVAPVSAYIRKAEIGYVLHISNISNCIVECNVQMFVLNINTGDKKEVLQEKRKLENVSEAIPTVVELQKEEILIAEVEVGGKTQRNWYKEGNPVMKKAEGLRWRPMEQGIEVWSEQYIHAVEIEGAENISDNYFSILPGDTKIITYDSAVNMTVSGYTF